MMAVSSLTQQTLLAIVKVTLSQKFSAGMVVSFPVGREHNDIRDAGAAMAIVNVGVIAAGAISQPLVGWLLDCHWSGGIANGVRVYDQAAYNGAFWVFPVSCMVATILSLFIRETRAKAQVSDA